MRGFRITLCALTIGAGAVLAGAQQASVSLVPPNPTVRLAELFDSARRGGGNRIIGMAVDSRHAAIAKVHLQLRDLRNGQVLQTTEANDRGEFAFGSVEPGTYVVELSIAGTVVALSDAVTLGGGELAQTLIRVPGRWDPGRQSVIVEAALAQFVGTSAADTMASATMMSATSQGIPTVDAGEPVSGGQ